MADRRLAAFQTATWKADSRAGCPPPQQFGNQSTPLNSLGKARITLQGCIYDSHAKGKNW
jgi:hypothetical protein